MCSDARSEGRGAEEEQRAARGGVGEEGISGAEGWGGARGGSAGSRGSSPAAAGRTERRRCWLRDALLCWELKGCQIRGAQLCMDGCAQMGVHGWVYMDVVCAGTWYAASSIPGSPISSSIHAVPPRARLFPQPPSARLTGVSKLFTVAARDCPKLCVTILPSRPSGWCQ